MNRSDPVFRNPVRGDVVKRGGNTYRVVERGVANSVRFIRTVGKSSLQGQKSLGCWQRLVAEAEVVTRAGR